jgi:O-antigen/teichoic acid export membrane protein
MVIKDKINTYFSGHERSVKAKKNILALFAVKGYSIVISLLQIPLTINLLDNYKYGVWIMLFNILSWIQIFDIGIGNGLRNKFAESMAKNDIKSAREYVSTGYIIMGAISFCLIVLFIIPWLTVDWVKVFNVNAQLSKELTLLIGITFFLTAIQFSLQLINTLLTADHKPAFSAIVMAISNTIVLILFFALNKQISGSLFAIGFIYCIVPVVAFIVASLIIFNSYFKHIKPKISLFRKEKVKDLFNLGIQFFIIQIAVLVIFQTDSLIIAHVLSPEQVTPYSIVFRYFGTITMVAGIILTPMWSAYTEAYYKDDHNWIKNIIIKQLKVFAVITILVILLLLIARPVILLWLKKDLHISNCLLIGMALYTLLSVWNNIFSTLLGGINKIRLGTFAVIITAGLNIPLSILFIKIFNYDSGGVILGTCISIGITGLLSPIQTYYFIFSKKKTEFLNKLLR